MRMTADELFEDLLNQSKRSPAHLRVKNPLKAAKHRPYHLFTLQLSEPNPVLLVPWSAAVLLPLSLYTAEQSTCIFTGKRGSNAGKSTQLSFGCLKPPTHSSLVAPFPFSNFCRTRTATALNCLPQPILVGAHRVLAS